MIKKISKAYYKAWWLLLVAGAIIGGAIGHNFAQGNQRVSEAFWNEPIQGTISHRGEPNGDIENPWSKDTITFTSHSGESKSITRLLDWERAEGSHVKIWENDKGVVRVLGDLMKSEPYLSPYPNAGPTVAGWAIVYMCLLGILALVLLMILISASDAADRRAKQMLAQSAVS